MKTIVYYMRHAKPRDDWKWEYDNLRPLTIEGEQMASEVANNSLFNDIDILYTSTSARAINTVKYLAEKKNLSINLVDGFIERRYGDIEGDRWLYREKQWADHDLKAVNGESFNEVEERNIRALEDIVKNNMGKRILICGHQMAGSTIIYHYNHNFGYDDFMSTPYGAIFELEFNDLELSNIKSHK